MTHANSRANMNIVEPISENSVISGGLHPVTEIVADLFSPDANLREAAVPRLANVGASLIPLLASLVLRPLSFALGRWPEWQQMLPANAILTRCDGARHAALQALVRIGEPSVPELIRLLQTSELELRVLAADALVQLGTPAAQEAISELLAEETGQLSRDRVRWLVDMQVGGSALLLMLIGGLIWWHPEAALILSALIPICLIGWLRIPFPDQRWYLRFIALKSLATVGDTGLVGTLAMGLGDPHPLVRAEAATGLIAVLPFVDADDREYLGAVEMRLLLGALDGDNPALAVAILRALQKIGDERALRRVAFLIDSPVHFPPVRAAAENCLPHFKLRIREGQLAQSLLRPVPTDDMESCAPETLLRSYHPEPGSEQQEKVLRSLGQEAEIEH